MTINLQNERLKLDQFKARIDYDRMNIERYKPLLFAVIRFADLSIKSLVVLNGISALAVLAFVGYTGTKNTIHADAIYSFGFGAAAATFTAASAYIAQISFTEFQSERNKKIIGNLFRFIAIISAVTSLCSFYSGLTSITTSFSEGITATSSAQNLFKILGYLSSSGPYTIPSIVIIIFLIIFCIMFREEFAEKIRGIERIGKDGWFFKTSQREAGGEEIQNVPNKDPSAEIWKNKIEEEIRTRNYQGDNLTERLKWALAANVRNALFERISRLIFGTQISALRRLSTCDGLSDLELASVHAEHIKRAGEFSSDITAWRGFLESNELIKYDDQKIRITEIGRLYLDFINKIGVDEKRFW